MNRQYPVSDENLIKAAQSGDREAATRLYYRHVDRVHRICYRIVLDSSQVHDCVQEVWLKVFRNLDRFEYDKSFTAWLNTITANTAIDYYRKWARQKNHHKINENHMEISSPKSQQHDEALIQQHIREALEEISVNQRTAFILRYFEDMPTAEIARTLGCAEGTVRVHISRSLLALRSKLAGKLNKHG
jgi:RNA polymerase sigma-70 factor (ECF subfamily)